MKLTVRSDIMDLFDKSTSTERGSLIRLTGFLSQSFMWGLTSYGVRPRFYENVVVPKKGNWARVC